MKSTKLIRLLSTFSETEIRRFREFVKSPYYNKNKNVIKLYESLIKFYPGFESGRLTEEYIFAKTFGNEKFDYFKIKNITSDLYNLGMEYLRLQPNIITGFVKDYNLIVQLRLRKLWKYHKNVISSLEKSFSEVKVKDSIFLYNNYLLTLESHLSNVLEKPNSIERIQEEFESFYEFSILNFLKFYNLMMHISKENKAAIDMKMFDDILRYIETEEVSSNPTIIAYKYLVLLAAKRKEEYYFFLKEHYLENYGLISYEDAYYAHMYLVGYCTDMYNIQGDRRFIKECYDLLKHSYLNGRVTLGELLYPNFINYAKSFVRAGDTKLAEDFITDYKGKLPEDQVENCLNFSYAFIAHKKGDFRKALELAEKVRFPWFIMKIQTKIMQIQLNYEMGNYEETREVIESFKKTLANEKGISEDYRNSIQCFLRNAISLINIQQDTDSKERQYKTEKLAAEVSNSQPNHFGVKFWLLEKMSPQ